MPLWRSVLTEFFLWSVSCHNVYVLYICTNIILSLPIWGVLGVALSILVVQRLFTLGTYV